MIPLMLFNGKKTDEITHQFFLGWNWRKEWFQIPLKGIKKGNYILFTEINYIYVYIEREKI